MSLKSALLCYIKSSKDPLVSFELGVEYFNIGQTASALSFFLRAAEYSQDLSLTYTALIKAGHCLAQQNRRYYSEQGLYMHAVNLNPSRPEAYHCLSLLHERKKEWLECYTYAQVADTLRSNAQKSIADLSFKPYGPIFQKAVAAFWIGRLEESTQLFYEIGEAWGYQLENAYRSTVLANFKFLGLMNHPHLLHTNKQELRVKFAGSEKIERNYSQAYQDIFVLTALEGKTKGVYLEIGAGDPFYGSNTALLDTVFGWTGVSVEFNAELGNKFKDVRSSLVVTQDAREIDYAKILSFLGEKIDYLQLDCEPAEVTYEVLTKIPFQTHTFAVITYEHDEYLSGAEFKEKSRELLFGYGYVLVANNVSPDRLCSFEDWWVHPSLVSKSIIDTLTISSNSAKKPSDFLLA